MPDDVEAADVLDTMANPHPRMWREATDMFLHRDHSRVAWAEWAGALRIMCAATGKEPDYFTEKFAAEVAQRCRGCGVLLEAADGEPTIHDPDCTVT